MVGGMSKWIFHINSHVAHKQNSSIQYKSNIYIDSEILDSEILS